MKNETITSILLVIVVSSGTCMATPGCREADFSAQKTPGQVLQFTTRPTKPTFRSGEDVVLRFCLKNQSHKRIFVSRYMPEEFVGVTLVDPDGNEVRWHGRVRSVAYSKDAFLYLEPGQEVSTSRTISEVDGEGFTITKAGRYTVRSEYSLGPPGYFAKIAPKESIPEGSFKAPETHFTISAAVGSVKH